MVKATSKVKATKEKKETSSTVEETKPVVEETPAVVETSQTTETTVTSSTTPQPITSQNSSSLIMGVVAVVLLLLIVGAGTLVYAATQFGTNTQLSKVAEVLPLEQIPGVKQFVKSPSQVLGRAVEVESDMNFHKGLNGREVETTSKLNVTGIADNLEFSGNLNMKQMMAYGKNIEQFKQVFSIGGQFEAGAVAFNPGEEAVKVEMLYPNTADIYFKLNLSPQVAKTLNAVTGSSANRYPSSVESNEPKIEDFLDKYMKLNFNEYTAFINEQLPTSTSVQLSEIDMDKLHKAYFELNDKLGPDMLEVYTETVGQWDRFATVSYQNREKVGKRSAVWVDAKIDSEKFADVSWEFVVGTTKVLKDHRQDLLEYCQKTNASTGSRSCEETFSAETFEKVENELNKNPDAKKKVEDAFKNFVKNMKFQKVRAAISPVDNSILKLEVEVTMEKEGFQKFMRALDAREREIEQFPLNNVRLIINSAETQRGHNFSVEVPAESINFVEKLREYAESQKRRMKQMQEDAQRQSTTRPIRY
jgi:hypothetical protein